MIELPNGNRCSEPRISPSNYKSVKKIKDTKKKKDDWVIQYRFYTAGNPIGKHVRIKNFNDLKDVYARRESAEKDLLKIKAELLRGYNPVLGKLILPPGHEAEPLTPLGDALLKGALKVSGEKHTIEVMVNAIKFLIKVAELLKINTMPVGQVRKRHVRLILEKAGEVKALEGKVFSPGNYNHHRSYLMMAFKELSELDAVESNPVLEIRKKKEVKRIREVLTLEQRRDINEHLFKKAYNFWLYLHIFFHSGSRSRELFKLKVKDVDLKNQNFRLIVRKGDTPQEVRKIIKDIAVDLWAEAIKDGKPNDYVFAKGLKPGPVAINSDQISERWKRHVKSPKVESKGKVKGGLGLNVAFYQLKHTHSDEIAKLLSLKEAGLHNSHTSNRTTLIYAVNEKERQAERLKKVGNKFA